MQSEEEGNFTGLMQAASVAYVWATFVFADWFYLAFPPKITRGCSFSFGILILQPKILNLQTYLGFKLIWFHEVPEYFPLWASTVANLFSLCELLI